MAYAAVASLLQTLDYVLKFTHFIFQIKKIQGRESLKTWQDFPALYSSLLQMNEETQGMLFEMREIQVGEIQRVLRHLSTESSSGLHQLKKEIVRAAELDEIIRAAKLARLEFKQSFNNKSPELMKLTYLVQELMNFLGGSVEDGEIHQVALQRSIIACQKFKKSIPYFCVVYTDTRVLYQELRFLLTNMDDISKASDAHALLNCIKDVAERARDAIDESIVQYQIESALDQMKQIVLLSATTQREAEFNYTPVDASAETDEMETKIKIVFHRIEDIRRNSVHEFQELSKELVTSGTRDTNDGIISLESFNISLKDSKEEAVMGFDDEQIRILEGLTGVPSSLEIVAIVGMGGIGKTTLARKLFNHTCHHFDCRAWVKIPQVYRLRDLLFGLLSSFVQRSDEKVEKNNTELAEDLYRSLKGKRYLIVMDDMWSIDAWNELKSCFPDDKIGSRIIVTSRLTELAHHINPNKLPHFMNLLDSERSWELIEKLVFGIAGCSPDLVDIGKEIAKRCRGLPLVIVVIAGILSRTNRALDSWKHMANNLSSIVSTDPEQCLDVLSLSYIYLPHHLRACFLYMGAFPEDCDIQARKLINLWVAEGFIVSENPKNLEQIAEEYLEALISRNLVLVEKRHFGGKVKSFRLHDFIREVCLREAQKENFMNVVRGSSNNFPAGMRNQRRLSFHLDPYRNEAVPPTLPRVSSFLCFTLGSDIVPDILFLQLEFKLLRVLDIYFLHFEYFPQQILKLIHLRYLALRVSYELPATMSQLSNLQTLVIHGPWPSRGSGGSATLLLEYWKMPSLRHLHCSVVCQLRNPPRVEEDLWQIFAPENLQTLSVIRLSSCREEVFSVMPGLKRLEIFETIGDYSSDRSCYILKNLVYLQELETLKCCFYVQNRNPRRLSCLDAFPSTLRQLSLSWSYLPWEDMTPIAMLPNLQVLKLKNYAFQGPKWLPTEEGFRRLSHLLIENTNLIRWVATVHQFPSIQNLILKSCKHLEQIPFGVDAIGSLRRIEVHNCSKPTENLAVEIQELVEVVIRSDHTPESHSESL